MGLDQLGVLNASTLDRKDSGHTLPFVSLLVIPA